MSKNDLAVIVVHFNWCNFVTPTRNLHRFVRYMDHLKVPLYGMELSLSDEFETKDYKNWKQLKVDKTNICFQKEACINSVVKTIPQEYTKIAWIDHDLFFENTNWYKEASEKLEEYKAIQLFSDYVYTGKCGDIIKNHPSMVKSVINNKQYSLINRIGVPGGACAARRELWKHGGLYPFSFLGGGDTLLLYTIMKSTEMGIIPMISGIQDNPNFVPYVEWKNKLTDYIKENDISYINGRAVHEWHGNAIDRKYENRYNIVESMDFSNTLSLDENGLVKISGMSDEFYNGILDYFRSRREDG